jgi:hypothetical protein
MNKEVAANLVDFASIVFSQASKLISVVEPKIDIEELEKIKFLIGKVLGEAYFLTAPIFKMYPELIPKELLSSDYDTPSCELTQTTQKTSNHNQ